ncbi:MAG: DegT/DnrJ/EryC1/StrS aminotransferase [Myxococcales bacterium]|nr:DegT/DnrJ/EryC1/StrS aminotransferase [Myxococcales bacterium]
MKVPLLDLRAQYVAVGPAVEAAVKRVLESGHYILGEDVAAFEKELSAATGRPHAVAVSSGTDALLLALMALDLGPGDEVITTPLSFFATAGAVVRLGGTPVFADIERGSFNLDPAAAARRVTPKTRAILPVHLFGRPAELDGLRATGVPVIEDAAQAIGVPSLGQRTQCATLSFFPSKNLGAAGDAGAVVCEDAAFADRLRLMRAHGSRPKYVHHVVGGNFRIDTLQAAILRVKLPHLAAWNLARQHNAARYPALLAGTPLTLPEATAVHVWHHYVVRVPDGRRDALRKYLADHDVETEVYYPTPLHLQPCFANLGYHAGDLPESERACAEVLALPVHPNLSEDQQDYVGTTVRAFFAGG